jgi:glycosyltransferase involved in cell wall biosynthesis
VIDILYSCWNRRRFVEASLACLAANTDWDKVARLVIYDDGSDDGTREVLDALTRRVPVPTVVRAEQAIGPVGIMLRHIADGDSADWFAKIDSDVCVPPGWLEAMTDVLDRHPKIELLGMEAGMTEVPGRDGAPIDEHGIQICTHIGGVGLFNRRTFIGGPIMRADGRNGLTEFQHEVRPPRAWVTPDLPVVLLDRLPFEPWVSLSEDYVARGWQREWPKWDPDWMQWAWEWFADNPEIMATPQATVGPFRFQFLRDGDDAGTGKVMLETSSGYFASTALGVARDEWDAFVEAAQ